MTDSGLSQITGEFPVTSTGEYRATRVIRVLVVDDSALVRRILIETLSRYTDIEVVGQAPDPYVARDLLAQLRPDVMTLDIEMPRMDGLSFLAKVMQHLPMPVVVCSSLTPQHSEMAMRALALGAVDVVGKPGSSTATQDVAEQLVRAVRAASQAHVVRRVAPVADPRRAAAPARPTAAAPVEPATLYGRSAVPRLIALGASTGGTQALEQLLRRFPSDTPGIVIVQHMPEHFTLSFAKRLDGQCAIEVREAKDGDVVTPGLALLAPGGKHLVLTGSSARWVVRVKDGPKVHHQRPSVDVLFQSVARTAGAHAVGAILTGMGGDGARGMLAMREAGAYTVAQDEATCVVYGMPREAVRLGAAVEVLPLDTIADGLLRALKRSVATA